MARGCDSTRGPYENDRGPIFPGTAQASSVSKLVYYIWHSVPDSKMHFWWLALKTSSIFEILEKFQSF